MNRTALCMAGALLMATTAACTTTRSERVSDDSSPAGSEVAYPMVRDNEPQALDDPALSAHGNDGAAMDHEFSVPDSPDTMARAEKPPVSTMTAEETTIGGASTAVVARNEAMQNSPAVGSGTTQGTDATSAVTGQPIDLNIATVEQLDALPGIDLTLAQSIIAFRNRAGTFRSVDELMMVQGMTSAKLEGIRRHITVADRGTTPGSDTMPQGK